MSGYCPAGKCECNAYFVSYNEHGKTEACSVSVIDLSKYEVCPWPSRQVRVEPQGDCDKCPKDDAYAAGRLADLREAREAVADVPEVTMLGVTGLSKKDALAAIDRLMEDGK